MKTLFITIAFFTVLNSFAQLGLTKHDVLKQAGLNYVDGDRGFGYYIAYGSTRDFPDECEHCGVVYLFDTDTMVTGIIIKRPVSDINEWVKSFNKNYVKVADLTWRDYEQNIKTEMIKTKDEISILITRWHDK